MGDVDAMPALPTQGHRTLGWVRRTLGTSEVPQLWCALQQTSSLEMGANAEGRGTKDLSPDGQQTRTVLSVRLAWRMLKRCARDAGIPTAVCNHTFRATGITAYLVPALRGCYSAKGRYHALD
jgi:hypothetical protein